MSLDRCAECGVEVTTSNPDTETHCPDCAGDNNHGKHYHRRRLADHRSMQQRHRLINGQPSGEGL